MKSLNQTWSQFVHGLEKSKSSGPTGGALGLSLLVGTGIALGGGSPETKAVAALVTLVSLGLVTLGMRNIMRDGLRPSPD